MGALRDCSNCGHTQMIGHNPVDGRLQWWTECEKCKKGNFMSPPDPRLLDALIRAFGAHNLTPPAIPATPADSQPSPERHTGASEETRAGLDSPTERTC